MNFIFFHEHNGSTIDNVVATDTEKVKLIDQIKSDLEALKARVDALESKP